MKMKQVLSAVIILAGSIATAAMAQDAMPMPRQQVNGPMMMHHTMRPIQPALQRMMKNAPVPVLVPILLHNQNQLGLTPAQKAKLHHSLMQNRQNFPAWRKAAMARNKALREALLNGQSGAALKPLEAAVIQDQERMLERGVRQTEFIRQLLTPTQWQILVKIAESY